MPREVRRKWRPRLWAVVLAVLGLVLCLPFAGLMLFKFYANQLVQQTEESLLTQAAVLSALYAELYEDQTHLDTPEAKHDQPKEFHPVFPALSLSHDTVRDSRPEPLPKIAPPASSDDQVYREIGPALSRIADQAQVQTLAGYRMLDRWGNVIGGSAEIGLSLAHVDEVASALGGKAMSVARTRIRQKKEPFIYGLSRGTRLRVFVAMPVVVQGEIIGAVYVSRSPNHIFRFLYGERMNLAKAALFILLSTGLIGFVFWRFITRPIHALIRRTDLTARSGARWQPIEHYGTREIETLAHSFQSLTERLQSQQDALKSYTAHVTHELKSPLTSVKGALELICDSAMSPEQRQRFIDNMAHDTERMENLLASMRAFSLSDQQATAGTCCLQDLLPVLVSAFPSLRIDSQNETLPLPLHENTLRIILTHLLQNSAQHNARTVVLEAGVDKRSSWVTITDDGTGISEGNRKKIMTPFFTTRRDQGGTGMGLNIVEATLEALGGKLILETPVQGTRFRILF